MNTPSLSRRSLLRGAGALLALPFLESLVPRAARGAAVVKPPVRLGIFTVTGGTVIESWRLKESCDLAGTKLPSILRPLEFAKRDLLLVSGLSHSGRSDNLNGHEHCAFMHLTAADVVKKEGGKPFAGISVDQAAAKLVGDQTFLPSMEMGLAGHENVYSFRDANTPVPFEANPRLVFDRMFRGRQPVVPNWSRRASAHAATVRTTAARNSYDQSVIDLVLAEAKDLQRTLGRADKQKLDEYLYSVRTVEQRIQFLEAKLQQERLDAASPGPSRLVQPQLLPENLPFGNFSRDIHRDPEKHGQYISIMSDLMVLAFQTDTTRVATFAVGSDEAMFPGVVTVGYEKHCHTLEHQGNAGRVEDADPIAREACRQMHAWYTGLFAEMLRKLAAIDEGGSTLLDNSQILYTSYMADGGHGTRDYPTLLCGRAGGTLQPGRHLAFGKNTPVANLYVEMLARMGDKSGEFGNSKTSKNAAFSGRLPGLV